jgi:hypothetical protein
MLARGTTLTEIAATEAAERAQAVLRAAELKTLAEHALAHDAAPLGGVDDLDLTAAVMNGFIDYVERRAARKTGAQYVAEKFSLAMELLERAEIFAHHADMLVETFGPEIEQLERNTAWTMPVVTVEAARLRSKKMRAARAQKDARAIEQMREEQTKVEAEKQRKIAELKKQLDDLNK